MWDSAYRPAAQVTDGVLDDFLGRVAEKHTGLGKVFVETGVAVVGVHGVLRSVKSVERPLSKNCCDKRYARPTFVLVFWYYPSSFPNLTV